MKKKIIIIAAVVALILAVAGTVTYILTNLDSIVKAAIEKYGSQATKTAVRVSSVKIKLTNGEGALRGLTIANPSGFSFPSIITLDNISVRIDVKSVAGTPVIIDNVLVSGPEVFYEMKENGTANVDVLRKNLTASGSSREKQPQKKGKEVRLRVRRLAFEKGKVHVRVAKSIANTIELPRLELADIGKQSGASPEEIARTIAIALTKETAKVVARTQGERLLRKGTENLLNKYIGK
jgi:hypothetical protein